MTSGDPCRQLLSYVWRCAVRGTVCSIIIVVSKAHGGAGAAGAQAPRLHGLTPATPHCATNVSIGSAVVTWGMATAGASLDAAIVLRVVCYLGVFACAQRRA